MLQSWGAECLALYHGEKSFDSEGMEEEGAGWRRRFLRKWEGRAMWRR